MIDFTARIQISLLLLILSLSSCGPQTKEAYLEDYKEFIAHVSEKGAQFSENDWTEANGDYREFSEEWYEKFRDEFTVKESAILWMHGKQYKFYRARYQATNMFSRFMQDDYPELKKQMEYYVENDMEDDLNALMEEAKETGDSAVVMMQEILDELEVELQKQH